MSEPKKKGRFPIRLAALLGGSLLLVAALSLINLSPNLSHLEVSLASGPEHGNYFAIAERLKKSAEQDEGSLTNLTSQGSVDNLSRLIAAEDECEMHFAMVQDGVPAPRGHGLELIARLPKSESVFILGRSAAMLTRFADLRNLRVGVGPKGSGTDHLARRIFESDDFAPLGLQLHNQDMVQQLKQVREGSLDLGIFVLDEDAQLIREAIRSGVQIASFEHLDIIARHFDFINHGRIGAGQYDPISVLPPADRRVLRVDTLILANDCASRTDTIALLTLLQKEFPNILQHNRDHGGSAFFPASSDAQTFVINGGPEWADTHVPWLVDIMPIGNWFYVVMGISILFNLMTSTHKFRLWRIDANRERAQQVFREVLGSKLTPAEINELEPEDKHLEPESIKRIDDALAELDILRDRCRVQENSPMVPMGQELAYRFQEEQMEQVLTAVRDFRRRIDEARGSTAEPETETETETET
jgi:TRAP-type uncharacterized transport system substrate-binding protein